MTTLAVGIMVKNESAIIERCLASILPIADVVVITDTGSTDDTYIKAGLFLQAHNKKYKIYFETFKNFAHNRSLVLERAKNEADYTLLIDADEILEFSSDFQTNLFKNNLMNPVYGIQMVSGPISYHLPRLTCNKHDWKYTGVTHEFLEAGQFNQENFNGSISIHALNDSFRRKSNAKFINDIELLLNGINETKNPALYRRYVFYLAQSYYAMQDYNNAIKYYKQRTELGGWDEEIFYSYYCLGHIYSLICHYDTPLILKTYLAAYQACPRRIESLAAMNRIIENKMQTTKKPDSGLFLEDALYV